MITNKQFLFGLVFASLFGGLIALGGFHFLYEGEVPNTTTQEVQPVKFTSNNAENGPLSLLMRSFFIVSKSTRTGGQYQQVNRYF